jgi:CheY-like chemotaxis protein
LFFTISRFQDAHKHLDRARKLFVDLGDIGTAARVDETRARTLLAEGRIVEAENLIKVVVKTLESGGEQGVLADALTTYGVVVARLGHPGRAKVLLERAMEVAETTGDIEGAGRARLSVIEELIDKLPVSELIAIYKIASHELRSSQDPESAKRLIVCADSLFEVVASTEGFAAHLGPKNWDGFSYKKDVLRHEAALIERALRDAGGSVTKASRLLGFRHHQSLISLINSRHKSLIKVRSVVHKRRRSIVNDAEDLGQVVGPRFSVLHIGNNETLGRLVAETGAAEGIHFESCRTGKEGVRMLGAPGRSFDLIVVGDGVPDERPLELVTRIRALAGQRKARILLVAPADSENEAWRAGVSGFVAKGEGLVELSSKITRLLEERSEKI